jgi:hypothetical protein
MGLKIFFSFRSTIPADGLIRSIPTTLARFEAIQDGRASGFVSEATLFIECLSFEDKLSYLALPERTKRVPLQTRERLHDSKQSRKPERNFFTPRSSGQKFSSKASAGPATTSSARTNGVRDSPSFVARSAAWTN